jgi:hypothetical protein
MVREEVQQDVAAVILRTMILECEAGGTSKPLSSFTESLTG